MCKLMRWLLVLGLMVLAMPAFALPTIDQLRAQHSREIVAVVGEREPDVVDLVKRANSAYEADDKERAARLYGEVNARVPHLPETLLRQCGAESDLKVALSLCRKALGVQRNARTLAATASALVRSDEPSQTVFVEARNLIDEALELDANDPFVRFAQLHVVLVLGDEPTARQALTALRGLIESKDVLRAELMFASFLAKDGTRFSEAEQIVGRARQQLPREPTTHLVAGHVALARGDLEALREASGHLLDLAPEDPEAHFMAAVVALSDGDRAQALSHLDDARARGLSQERYDQLAALANQRAPLVTAGIVAGWGIGLWLGGMVLLLLLGLGLSHAALHAAHAGTSRQGGRADGMAAWLRGTYRVVLWLCCLYYYLSLPLVVLLVVGAVAGVVLFFLLIGWLPVKLLAIAGVLGLITVGAILRSVFVRRSDEDPGARLDLSEHPRLKGMLEDVAAKVDTRTVDTVFVTPGVDVAVFERGGMVAQLRGTAERCLILGVGVLDGMSEGQLRSILAHEYGHFSNRDTAGGGFALSVRRSLMTMAIGIAQGGAAAWFNPAWLFLQGFYSVFLRVSHGASRLQEVLADRWAALTYGSRNFVGGLKHVIRRSVEFDFHVESTLNEVIREKRALANLYTYAPEAKSDNVEQAIAQALEAEPSPFDSHPSPQQRIELVNGLGAEEPEDAGDDPAWDLFKDRAYLETEMTHVVRQRVEEAHGVAISSG